ncbi:YfbM family protein [Treponema pedis]|uniref:YfbM family protein n=1 Tax=Treponema pedis TaxID=409322 RepID=UPI0004112DCA|nr:YfbM family protein [Treponema pedis]
MGMIANYQYINDEQLKSLKNFNGTDDELFEEVEEWNEEAEILLDVDKMWDVLHFVFTGVDSGKLIENNPLSEAVVGVTPMDNVEDFIAYTEKTRVAEIVSALEQFDMKQALENFSMEKCKKANLYPNIWDYDDKEEVEELKEEISDYFQDMKNFYKEILEINGNVMVTIY